MICDGETKYSQHRTRAGKPDSPVYTHNKCANAEKQIIRIAASKDKACGQTVERPHHKALAQLKKTNRPLWREKILAQVLADNEERTHESNCEISKMLDDVMSFTTVYKRKSKGLYNKKDFIRKMVKEETLSTISMICSSLFVVSIRLPQLLGKNLGPTFYIYAIYVYV